MQCLVAWACNYHHHSCQAGRWPGYHCFLMNMQAVELLMNTTPGQVQTTPVNRHLVEL